MKVRTLGLADAIELASILAPYVNVKSIRPDSDALEFIAGIVEKVSPQEYLRCVCIMTKKTEEDVKKEDYSVILASFIAGLQRNRIISLLSFYKSLGFNA